MFAPSVKSAASVSVMAVKASAPVPLFVTVMVCAALDVPASWLPKLMLVGRNRIQSLVVAVPESDTVCGLPAALSEISRSAAREADARANGANVTLTVQLAPARTLGGQLFVCGEIRRVHARHADPIDRKRCSACVQHRDDLQRPLAIPTLCGAKFRLAGEI